MPGLAAYSFTTGVVSVGSSSSYALDDEAGRNGANDQSPARLPNENDD